MVTCMHYHKVLSWTITTLEVAVALLISFPPCTAFLVDDIPPNKPPNINCNDHSSQFIGWSLSPDGSETNKLLDTSLAKYTEVGDRTLQLSNLNKTDEGLYRCVYQDGSIGDLCIYVYSKFMHIKSTL